MTHDGQTHADSAVGGALRPRVSGLHRAFQGIAFGGVLLAIAATAGSASAADVSVSKPVGQLFARDAASLSPAGERWLRAQVADSARQPDHMVVVQVPGATPALQQQRAAAIRQRLAALGVEPRHIYLEAAPAEQPVSRVAGL